MSEGKSTDASNTTKLCHIVKRADFDGYGFNLHSEKSKEGQFVGKIDAGSPAEEAGLKEGDRIIEVNGVAIGNETHKQVVQRVKAISCEVRLLLISAEEKPKQDNDNDKLKSDDNNTKSNIESISMTSTKRISNGSQNSETTSAKNATNSVSSASTQPMVSTKIPQSPVEPTAQSTPTKKGGLVLPETAAEMRARLLSKKKFDPKNENVDLKQKFEIMQKL